MGDRANIAVQSRGERVYFYTHWSGSDVPEIVRSALERNERWDDPSYLARIIFCRLVRGDETGETGYGISTKPGDNQHPIFVVDCGTKTVNVQPDRRKEFGHCHVRGVAKAMTFGDYAALEEAEWGTPATGRGEED